MAELRSDYSISMENLKSNTDITDSLTSDWTNKAFRGQVTENGFKIISSEIGRGAICVLNGKFDGKNGEIVWHLFGGLHGTSFTSRRSAKSAHSRDFC